MWKLLVGHPAVSDQSFARECNESAPIWVCNKTVKKTVAIGHYPLLSVCDMDMDPHCVRLVTYGNPSYVENLWVLKLELCYVI